MRLFQGAPKIMGLKAYGKTKLPPGQVATAKFPVLNYGETPYIPLAQWRLRVFGLVEHELERMWEEFMRLPQTTLKTDFHCVTTWSGFDFQTVAHNAGILQ